MKHNLLKSVIISVILLMGVSNAWAYVNGSAYVYFDPNDKWNYTNYYFASIQETGNWQTKTYKLSNITNTKLYYLSTTEHNDAGYISFGGQNGTFDGGYWGYDSFKSYITMCGEKCNWGLNHQNTYLFYPSANTKGTSLNPKHLGGGYDDLNSEQTIKTVVDGTVANSKATISITSYKMTANGTATEQTATLGTGAKDSYITAARTATTTLTVGTVATGYQFDGWYTAATDGTQLSADKTYTYYPTAATTVYARFSIKKHTVLFGVHSSGHGSLTAKVGSTSISSGNKVNYGSEVVFTATPSAGYQIEGWYSNSTCTNPINNGTNNTYTVTIKGGTNVYVKYEEKFAVMIQPNNANYGTVSPSGSQQVGASGIEIEATAKYGYKFDQWTKTGSVTIEDTSDPTTVIKATGTGTVTAAFIEDLATTKWYISGNGNGSGTDQTPGSPFTGWATNGIQMFKKSGHSTEEIYYCTITANTIASSNDHFPFKVYNATNGEYWGNNDYWVTKENNSPTLSSSSGNNMKFRPYLTGTYEFKLDATNASSPVLTVTWPVYNQLRISAANPADATNTGEFDMTGSGTYTVTRSLKANTTYTFKIVYNSDWYGANSGNLTRASATKTLSTSGGDLTIKTDFAGNYTFTFNSSTKALTVTYPTAYTLTYGSGTGGSGTVTANNSIKSGDLVLAGTSVSLTATPASGYDFAAWYSDQACEGDVVSSNTPYTFSINSNTTLYAKWTANTYTVTLNPQSGTGGTTSVTATYGSAMPAITKPTRTGYTFNGYYDATSGGTQYYKADGSSARTWNKTAATTLYAQWTANKYNITYKDQNTDNFTGTHETGYPTQHTYGTATTLKTATKTGYTFGGWYTDQACTNKVTSLGATAYTADITLYAKWTINQYTLDFGAGEGGSVVAEVKGEAITSPATLEHGTSITLKATPEGENAFAQWVDGNGNQISTQNPYELTITKHTTLKAEFTSPSKVYLKPFDFWKSDGARIAAYYWGAAGNNWIELSPVDCEGHYYSVDIPAGYSNIIFARLKPSTDPYYDPEHNGFNWKNAWNQTADLTVQTNGKNLYDMHIKDSRIYLKPNSNWKTDGARFAAFFKVNADNNDGGKWMSMFQLDSDNNYYWCDIPTDKNYIKVIFCRMKGTDATNNWGNKWNDFEQDIPSNEHNCYTLNNESWSEGSWSCYQYNNKWTTFTTPTYDVTIKPTIHGTYSVVCNGRAYPVTYKKDVVIPNVPMGTVLTIQDVKPNKEAEYTSDIIYKESANAEYQKLVGNQITVCGNTTIDENFITENTHVVYLRIPNGLAWETDDHQYLYAYDKLKHETVKLTAEPTPNNYEPGYTYYKCTIPTGTHTIRFEYHNSGNTLYQTHDFPHVMPLGSLNCYTIHSKEGETSIFNGYWSELLSNGDYRLLYVEQVVEKDQNNKTVITRKKAHPSNIIKKRTETGTDIVSLHVYNNNTYQAVKNPKATNDKDKYYTSPSNSAVILQQYDGSKWVDIQHHMVFGPLEAHVYTAMLPGRRNATAEDEPLVAQLKADYGIKAIINDTDEDKGNGVWNFPIKQTVDGGNTTVELMRKDVHRYTGEYYIRTDVANGGWFNYNPTNHMTRSDEAKANSNFSHYYCKWVGEAGVNVKFTVANDYGYAISDTLEADRTDLWGVALANKMVGDDQTLPEKANVRFAWNEYSNFVHRAYIAGSAFVRDRFLVLEGDANIFDAQGNALIEGTSGTERHGLKANEEIFRDNSNWIYYADVQMKPKAPVKVTAKYDNHTQYFIGKQDQTVTLLQGTGEEKYLIRMLYDFKTNQLISAYVPGASPDVHAISTNLMLIRQNNNEATQLIFNNETPSDMINIPTDRRAYGVIEFTEKRLIQGKDDENKSLNDYEKSLYWISFPFNVDVSKAICFGEYGKHWIIQEYNGARRAAEGMWLDSETFWDYKWDQDIILEAGKGYVLALDVDQIASDGLFGLAGNRPIGIYFPSTEYINTAITEQRYVSTTVPAHVCTINRATPKGDRRIADSHWNVIGVPSYVNAKGDYNYAEFTELADIETQPKEVKYYYRWDGDFNAYTAMEKEGTKDFLSTHAYMVQFAGQINWQNIFNVNGAPKELAAKQSTDSEQEHRLRLELHQNGNKADHTFVRLQDEDGVTIRFDFNHDLCKVINAGANIYSIITAEESPVEVAANVMPIAETIIPVGVKITAAGEYTFAMPEGTDGIVVELIDYETNTTTNLLLDNYTVNLGKGTFDNRFALHIKPNKTATGVDNIGNETTSDTVKKYLIDGILYMQKDGVLYDAQGKLVR